MAELLEKDLLENGKIHLYGEIDENKAESTIANLKYIFFTLKKKEIYLFIHSSGGDTDACSAIIDEIIGLKKLKAKIYTVAIGKAYSSGAMILSVGTERYATENCSLMLHPVSFDCPVDYISQQKNYTQFIEKQWDSLSSLVAKQCNYKTKARIEEFRKSIKDGLWLTAEEAIDFGLIDGIWNYIWEQ